MYILYKYIKLHQAGMLVEQTLLHIQDSREAGSFTKEINVANVCCQPG